MQVKKFEAPTVQEALDTIKRELGPEAIILQTRKHHKGFGLMSKPSVEVTAAVSDKAVFKKNYFEKKLDQKGREIASTLTTGGEAEMYDRYLSAQVERGERRKSSKNKEKKKGLTARRYIDIEDSEGTVEVAQPTRKPKLPDYSKYDSRTPEVIEQAPSTPVKNMTIEEELGHLKSMIAEMKNTQDKHSGSGAQALMRSDLYSNPILQDVFEQLVIGGLDKRYAATIIKQTHFALGEEGVLNPDLVLDQVAYELMENCETMSILEDIQPKSELTQEEPPQVIALVGPTGVGKTTTIAKIASQAKLKYKLKVALINIDTFKVAAHDQLETYSKILNIPFRTIATIDEFKSSIQDLQSYDLVLVDTSGSSQKDTEALSKIEELIHSVPQVRSELVLSVTTRDTELYDMAKRFSMFRPEGIIFSKLDEGMVFGAIYNVSQRLKLPIAFFTTGQRVPEDIESASQERMASLIMDL